MAAPTAPSHGRHRGSVRHSKAPGVCGDCPAGRSCSRTQPFRGTQAAGGSVGARRGRGRAAGPGAGRGCCAHPGEAAAALQVRRSAVRCARGLPHARSRRPGLFPAYIITATEPKAGSAVLAPRRAADAPACPRPAWPGSGPEKRSAGIPRPGLGARLPPGLSGGRGVLSGLLLPGGGSHRDRRHPPVPRRAVAVGPRARPSLRCWRSVYGVAVSVTCCFRGAQVPGPCSGLEEHRHPNFCV